jgi:photosynthetic reaction center H subunit
MRENMRHHTSDDARRVLSGAAADSSLARLGELSGYKVADGDPDIRGWEVKTADGRTIGSVDDLIVDTVAMRARYVEVKADKSLLGVGAEDRCFLIPVGAARLNEHADVVVIDRLPAGGFTAAWSYERGQLTHDREAALQSAYGYSAAESGTSAAGSAGDDLFDDRRFWANRRNGREGEAYIARSEEEPAAGKRPVKGGEIDVRERR